jgi:hypothetical protein
MVKALRQSKLVYLADHIEQAQADQAAQVAKASERFTDAPPIAAG